MAAPHGREQSLTCKERAGRARARSARSAGHNLFGRLRPKSDVDQRPFELEIDREP
jgi:hypothetical protein